MEVHRRSIETWMLKNQWSQIHITLMRNWIRIRIKVKILIWVRIRMTRIRNMEVKDPDPIRQRLFYCFTST